MKSIKYTICLMIICLTCTVTIHAQKCHFDEEKKDDFTGEMVRNAKVRIGTFFYSWWVLMEQKGTKYYITVQSAATGKVDDIIPRGSKVLIKLDNGKVAEVVVSDDCVPNHNVQSNTIITTWLPKGEVSKEVMQQLSESETDLIRMNIGGKDFTSPEASGKAGRKMMEIAQCMLK